MGRHDRLLKPSSNLLRHESEPRNAGQFSSPERAYAAGKGSVEARAAAIKEKGLARAKIGIDEMGITPQCMDQLKSLMPDATFIRSFSLFERVRAVKTAGEIEILRQAARNTERAIDA